MGFFSDDEVQSLRIMDMILHVVGEEEFRPAPAREVEHEEFFIDRIRDTDVAAVHTFEPESNTKALLERIARGEDQFEAAAQALSRDFSRLHVGASREGAFFVFELSTDDPHARIYSLIKYDYRQVIEQTPEEEGGLLRLIVQAFITDRKAIQKSALIRVVDGVAEGPVSARDRMKLAPDIGDYFASFLDVSRHRSDEELNKSLRDVLRETMTACKDILPGQDVARAVEQATGALRSRQQITENVIEEAVIGAAGSPDDEGIRSELQATVRRKIKKAKLTGLAFRPDRRVLRQPHMRQVRTVEGVTLTYPDAAQGAVVRRQQRRDGSETFTIETQRVTEDRLVSDKTRGTP